MLIVFIIIFIALYELITVMYYESLKIRLVKAGLRNKNMKFLLCLICLITVSCNAVIDPKSETIRSEDGYYIGTAHKFKFEGHDYISFTKGHGVAVVHNPKCHCNLNEDY